MLTQRIGLIGAGNMAQAIVAGLVASGVAPSDRIMASDPEPDRLDELARAHGIETTASNAEVAARADVLVLAVKPQVMDAVLAEIKTGLGDKTLLVSIAAGVPTARIERTLGSSTRVIRVMPNTPALVSAGASALARGASATDEDVETARAIFGAVGTTVVLGESQLDAVTGLSGSGPAYVMLVVEALADGGVKAGLPRDVSLALAIQTVLGSAEMLARTGEHPARLKDKVTSPGGTTIYGLGVLEAHGVRGAFVEAVEAATRRAAELGRGSR